jgi:rubredoxin
MSRQNFRRWQCFFCGAIYDEALGCPEEGIAPGTIWADIPETWVCPDCGASKADYTLLEQ